MNEHAIYRWELRQRRPMVALGVLLYLLPQAAEGTEVLARPRGPVPSPGSVLRSSWSILRYMLGRLTLVVIPTVLGFSVLWLVADTLGHPIELTILSYGLAGWVTVIILYQSLGALLQNSASARHDMRRRLAILASVCLPLLMYATSSPWFGEFTVAHLPNGGLLLFDWLVFYAYLAGNLLTLGALEGLFAIVAAVQPASWGAAVSTFWVKAIMLLGAVGILIDAWRRTSTPVQVFTGTVRQFRDWSQRTITAPPEEYTVSVVATETAYGLPRPSTRLHHFLSGGSQWEVGARGELKHPMGEVTTDADAARLQKRVQVAGLAKVAQILNIDLEPRQLGSRHKRIRSWSYRLTKGAKHFGLFGLFAIILLALVALLGLLPFLGLRFALGMSLGASAATGFIIGVLVLHLSHAAGTRRAYLPSTLLVPVYLQIASQRTDYGQAFEEARAGGGDPRQAWLRTVKRAAKSPTASVNGGLLLVIDDRRQVVWLVSSEAGVIPANVDRVVFAPYQERLRFDCREGTSDVSVQRPARGNAYICSVVRIVSFPADGTVEAYEVPLTLQRHSA